MSEYTVETVEMTTAAGPFRVRVVPDDDAESPREWDNIATMVLAHNRYNLPREGGYEHVIDEAFERGGYALAARYLSVCHDAVVMPVYGYDHGQLTLRVGDSYACPWDSALAGLVYMPRSLARAELGDPSDDKIRDALRAEVQVYDQYLTGDVYGYIVEREIDGVWEDADTFNSCWGLFGADYAAAEGIAAMEAIAADITADYLADEAEINEMRLAEVGA